jgi:biopolymer transport protein ExbD
MDAAAVGLWAVGLALVGVVCLLVPQRIAQRPAARGVMTIQMNRAGALRVWNQPIATSSLPGLLQRAEQRSPGVRIRLVPDADVPWGMVQAVVERLEAPKRNLELQLP